MFLFNTIVFLDLSKRYLCCSNPLYCTFYWASVWYSYYLIPLSEDLLYIESSESNDTSFDSWKCPWVLVFILIRLFSSSFIFSLTLLLYSEGFREITFGYGISIHWLFEGLLETSLIIFGFPMIGPIIIPSPPPQLLPSFYYCPRFLSKLVLWNIKLPSSLNSWIYC